MRTPGRGPLRGGTPTSGRLAARPRQRAPLPPAGQAGPGGRRTRGGAGRGGRGDEPAPGALRDPRGPRAAESPLGSRLHGEGVTARPGAQLPTAGPAGTPLTAAWQVRPRPGVGFSKDRNAHQCPGALTVSVPERWTSLAERWELTLPAPPAGSARRGPRLASPAGAPAGPPQLTRQSTRCSVQGGASRRGRAWDDPPGAPAAPAHCVARATPPTPLPPAQGRGCCAPRRGSRRGRGASLRAQPKPEEAPAGPDPSARASPPPGSDTVALSLPPSRARVSCPGGQKPNAASYRREAVA